MDIEDKLYYLTGDLYATLWLEGEYEAAEALANSYHDYRDSVQ